MPRCPARVSLAASPTPIQPLPRLGAALGLELSVKRDDLTGFAESGNKARKLEFLLHDALEQGADTLITVGALQSNCARATAVVAARLGLRCVLGLRGTAPEVPDGNLFLATLFGARAVFVPPEAVDSPEALFVQLAEDVRRAGGRPYVIPESGSNELGAFGYAAAVEELQQQIAAGVLAPPDAIVVAAWSGGTLAGLHLGKALFGLRAEIWGVPVQFDAETIRASVWATVRKSAARIGAEVHVERDAIHLLDGYQGDGRAGVRPEELAVVARAAREGLLLDPVYTAKAFLALEDTARRKPGLLGRRVLFLHTGGGFGVFPFRAPLARLPIRAPRPPEARRSMADEIRIPAGGAPGIHQGRLHRRGRAVGGRGARGRGARVGEPPGRRLPRGPPDPLVRGPARQGRHERAPERFAWSRRRPPRCSSTATAPSVPSSRRWRCGARSTRRATAGIGWAVIRNTTHQGAMAYYALMAAEAGMAGIAIVCSPPNMAPFGARVAGRPQQPHLDRRARQAGTARSASTWRRAWPPAGSSAWRATRASRCRPGGRSTRPAADDRREPREDPPAVRRPQGLRARHDVRDPHEPDGRQSAPRARVLSGEAGAGRHRQNSVVAAIDIGAFTDLAAYRAEVDRLIDGIRGPAARGGRRGGPRSRRAGGPLDGGAASAGDPAAAGDDREPPQRRRSIPGPAARAASDA